MDIKYLFMAKTARLWPDRLYLKTLYKVKWPNKETLNLDEPKTFNEKLNWLKLYDHNPDYHIMADKYAAKDFVRKRIGDEYVVPCYGVWEKFDDIDFDKLPNQFIIKATHDSGGLVICRDKAALNREEAKRRIESSQKTSGYWSGREWAYKDIKPRIIVDQLLDDGTGGTLKDYKFWCFNGVPKVMYCTNKSSDIFENFYDMDYNVLDIDHGFRRAVPEIPKPQEFELMRRLAEKLSSGIPFVRVDFFDVNGKVYFGEYTFYDWGGFKPFEDNKWDAILGSWIKLPPKRK